MQFVLKRKEKESEISVTETTRRAVWYWETVMDDKKKRSSLRDRFRDSASNGSNDRPSRTRLRILQDAKTPGSPFFVSQQQHIVPTLLRQQNTSTVFDANADTTTTTTTHEFLRTDAAKRQRLDSEEEEEEDEELDNVDTAEAEEERRDQVSHSANVLQSTKLTILRQHNIICCSFWPCSGTFKMLSCIMNVLLTLVSRVRAIEAGVGYSDAMTVLSTRLYARPAYWRLILMSRFTGARCGQVNASARWT